MKPFETMTYSELRDELSQHFPERAVDMPKVANMTDEQLCLWAAYCRVNSCPAPQMYSYDDEIIVEILPELIRRIREYERKN